MSKPLLCVIIISLALPADALSRDMTLEYVNSNYSNWGYISDAVTLDEGRVILTLSGSILLVDVDDLISGNTFSYIDALHGIYYCRETYLKDSTYLFVNLFKGGPDESPGFAVAKIIDNNLQHIITIDEPDIFYEGMKIDGDYLYIAAHNYGIRIYDITDPENPSLTGSLDSGFVDAWAIDVHNDTAYVADGAGGLKVIDVSDKAVPALIAGETMGSAVGTSEDILYYNGTVFVAAGGAGLTVYQNGNPDLREIIPIEGTALDLCFVGDCLAAAGMDVLTVFDISDINNIAIAAEEKVIKNFSGSVSICLGVGSHDDSLILAANFNYLDVYSLIPAEDGNQPDLNCSHLRIRFPASGGSENVTIWNNGQGSLNITDVEWDCSGYNIDYSGGVLSPGQSANFDITYNGTGDSNCQIKLYSNDPNESPYTIRAFGNTVYHDPGDPAINFTLPIIMKDSLTGDYMEETFTLSSQTGKVVWFTLYHSM